MRKSTLKKVIIASIVLYALLGLIKNKVIIPHNDNAFIQWAVDLISFAISFLIPLWIGIQSDAINDIRLEINKIRENLDLNNYGTFKFLFKQLEKKTNGLTKYSHSLAVDYLFLRFYKPIMDFFHLETKGTFYNNPSLVKTKINEIVSVVNEVENKIKEENLSGSVICQREDRIEIIEKVISISSFYNFYYPLGINSVIINLIKNNSTKFVFNEYSLRLSCAVALNDFNFDKHLFDSKELLESDKNEFAIFEKIKNDSIKLAQVVNSIKSKYNTDEIVSFYLDFFELKKYISNDNNILILIFNTELLAFYDYLRSSYSKAILNDKNKKTLLQKLQIKSTQYFAKIDNLGDFILTLFKLKYAIELKDYLNEVFSKELNEKKDCNYHPIFDLYFALNSKVTTGISYSPNFKGINSNYENLKPQFIKDIHVWYINKMNSLIRNNQILEAQEIYSELDFDTIHKNIANDTVYKYSMLLCKSVFLNRLNDKYQESIELLKLILEQTSLSSDYRNAKHLIFTFAFENHDKPTYREIYDNSNVQEKDGYIKIANWIRLFEKDEYLHIGNWLYVSYPVLNGYLLKDCKAPKVITGANNV